MPELLQGEISSPFQRRAESKALVCRDLLGPAGEPEEEVDERTVRGRYILR